MTLYKTPIKPLAAHLSGFFWPLLTVLGGMTAYFLLFGFFVDPLTPSAEALRGVHYTFLWEQADPPHAATLVAADLSGRYALAIPSVLLVMTYLAVVIASFWVVLPCLSPMATRLGLIGAPTGALIGYLEQYNNPVRSGVANCPPGSGDSFCPLDQALARSGGDSIFTQQSYDLILRLVDVNSALSVSAIFLLGIAFLHIARVLPDAELTPETLRTRRVVLSICITLAGFTLLFSVVTAHGFYHHAARLMPPEDAKALSALASTGALYWGAVYSTVFTVIAIPAVFGMYRDVDRAGRLALPGGNHKARKAWRADHGLELGRRDLLGPVLATLSPVFATPVLDLLRPYLLGGGP